MTEPTRYHRSVSQYKTLTGCGERYRLERLMKKVIPPSPSPWTALGVALHEAFCDWEKFDRDIDVCEYFLSYYDNYIDEQLEIQPDLSLWTIPPPGKDVNKAIKTYRERGLERDVPTYRDRCLEATWEIYRFEDGSKALELEFEVEFAGVPVKGAVDRVQWWPERGYASLEDLKSGNLDEFDRRQLGTYAYALKKVYDIPIRYGRYWFTKVDRPSEWWDMTRYTEEYLTDIYTSVDTTINKRLFLPNPGKQCELCQVKPWCRENGWMDADVISDSNK